MKRRLFAILTALALLCALAVSVCAEDTAGSVCVTMTYRGEAIPGGTMTLYLVALPGEDAYVYTGGFAGCGIDLSDITAAQTAQELADYAVAMGITGTTAQIDGEGKVCFDDLEYGLYLMVQDQAAEGYTPVSPFLVTVPGQDGEADVDASPKLTVQPAATETTPPTTTTETTPTDSTLPQTGQLNWPVPVLAAAGVLVFLFGWYLTRSARKDG